MNYSEFVSWYEQHQTKQSISPLIMGILNVTPDSFSDGGKYFSSENAVNHAGKMIEQGADIIDIGGESTRPGSQAVSIDEELERVIPVIETLHQRFDNVISIDTSKPEVMQAAVDAGACIINDVKALENPKSLTVAKNCQAFVYLMHMQNTPDTMQDNPTYFEGVIDTINTFFEQRINVCVSAGIDRQRLILDPGFGFGKTTEDNLTIINNIPSFHRHKLPLLIGVSRKNTIGQLLNQPVANRMVGSLTLNVVAMLKGINIIRTHDVFETYQAVSLINALAHNKQA